MGHFFSKVSLFIDKKEAAAHLILDQDFATAPFKIQFHINNLNNIIKILNLNSFLLKNIFI